MFSQFVFLNCVKVIFFVDVLIYFLNFHYFNFNKAENDKVMSKCPDLLLYRNNKNLY